jgi:hypothetical protein
MASFRGKTLRIFALASVLGIAAAGLAAATPASAATTASTAINRVAIPSSHRADPFQIFNFAEGLCVGYTSGDSPVTLQTCDSTNVVTWSRGAAGPIVYDSEGNPLQTYQVTNSADPGQCLGILGNSLSDGAHAYAWGCNGKANQYWALDTNLTCDSYHPYYNGNGLVLGVEVSGTGEQTIVQWAFQGEPCNNQWWALDAG